MADLTEPPDRSSAPGKRDRGLGMLYWVFGVLVVLALLWTWWSHQVNSAHQRLLQEARQAASGISVKEVPDEDNAARDYERAYDLFTMPAREYGSKFSYRLAIFELDIGSEEIEGMLAGNARCLLALAEAAAKPDCVFVADYSKGIATRLPSLLNARSATLLLCMAARRAAHDGRHGEAAERLRQALCLARGIGQPRFLICHMISVAGEDIVIEALRDILVQSDPDEDALRAMLAMLREHGERRRPFRESMHVERLLDMLLAAEIGAGAAYPYSDWKATAWFRLRRSAGRVLRDAREWERLWDRAEEAYGKPCPQALRELTALTKSPEYARQSQVAGSPYSLVAFSFLATWRSDAEELALLRCARLAVACRLHQARTGKLPESLAELAGYFPTDFAEVATDPFSGQQMLYKRSETGFTVYSVGIWKPGDDGAPRPHEIVRDPDLTFPVDRKAWEAERAQVIQRRQQRAKAVSPAKPPPPPPAPRR